MACQRAIPLDDATLLAYGDGEADAAVTAHVAACPACQQRAAALAGQQAALAAALARASCPSAADLRDYHFQLLAPARSAAIVQHLALCPHCTRELFEDYVEVAPVTVTSAATGGTSPLQSIRQGVQALVEQVTWAVATLLESGATPALAVRGEAAGGPARSYLFQVDDAMISLVVYGDHDRPDRLAIEGQALLGEVATDAPPTQVHLWQAERLAHLCVLDAAGDFAMRRLEPGQYELILSGPRFKIKLPEFTIGAPPSRPQ